MSAPSDGARADARKRLAAEVVAPDERIVAVLNAHNADDREGGYYCACGWVSDEWTHGETRDAHNAHVGAELAGVIADAKAEALRDAARDWPTAQWWGEFDDWLRERAEVGR